MLSMHMYNNPPIREAVIELRFGKKLSGDELYQLKSKLIEAYGDVDEVLGTKFELKIERKTVKSYQESELERLELDIEPNLKARIAKESVSWHRLAPYDNWESFIRPVNELWDIVEGAYDLRSLSRIGVKMLNDIGIPFGDSAAIDLESFVTILTRIPDNFPAKPVGFVSQIHSVHEREKAQSMIAVSSQRVEADSVHIMLNIDTFRAYQGGYEGTFAELDPVLTTLRNLKNNLFESCITDSTRELFK